jgi:hypothetical protein
MVHHRIRTIEGWAREYRYDPNYSLAGLRSEIDIIKHQIREKEVLKGNATKQMMGIELAILRRKQEGSTW